MIRSLSEISVFSSFLPDELASLACLASIVEFSCSNELSFRDSLGEFFFYILVSGHAKLTYQKHKSFPVRICGPGDFVGYGEWHCKYPHRAEALGAVRAWRFSKTSFQALLHTSPNLQDSMIKVLCDILSIKDERISALENHSVSNRVASVLVSFAEKFGHETLEGVHIDLKIDRETIAKLAGTVTESLSRQISEFEDEKILIRRGRAILIRDMQKLILKIHR